MLVLVEPLVQPVQRRDVIAREPPAKNDPRRAPVDARRPRYHHREATNISPAGPGKLRETHTPPARHPLHNMPALRTFRYELVFVKALRLSEARLRCSLRECAQYAYARVRSAARWCAMVRGRPCAPQASRSA